MSIFGTIKTAVGKGASRIEEQIEKEKRQAEEQSDRKRIERKRYDELLARGIQPSVALKTIESERGIRPAPMIQAPKAERYQKIYPSVKQTKTQAKQTSKKAMVFGALKTIASNVQANVASGRAGVGGTFKQPDMGIGFGDFGFGQKPGTDMFGFPTGKQKREKKEPVPTIKGYDMWGQPIYGKPRKEKHGKGKGRGRDIVIHLR